MRSASSSKPSRRHDMRNICLTTAINELEAAGASYTIKRSRHLKIKWCVKWSARSAYNSRFRQRLASADEPWRRDRPWRISVPCGP